MKQERFSPGMNDNQVNPDSARRTQPSPIQYQSLTVSHPTALLQALVASAPEDTSLSLEGEFDLSASGLANVTTDETAELRRSTFFAMDSAGNEIQSQFVVIPLTTYNRERLTAALEHLDFKWDVWHAQMAHANKLVFAAYDCFMQGSVILDAGFADAEQFVRANLIQGYELKSAKAK